MLNHIFYGFGHKHIYDLDELESMENPPYYSVKQDIIYGYRAHH